MKRRIVPGGILALSLAVVLMAATASTASAHRSLFPWCAPLPATPLPPDGQIPGGGCLDAGPREVFDFGDRQVGTTSPAQGFYTVVLRGDFKPGDRHFDPRVSVSGDYTQTNNCPPTLLATEGCLITVTFAPRSTGPKKGTLSIGPEGPTAKLSGRGVTTRTPPVLPLTLEASVRNAILGDAILGTRHGDASLEPKRWRRGVVSGITADTNIGDCLMPQCPDYDTKVVLKHLKQLKEEPTPPKIKIKFVATDEFGQTATEEGKVELCSRVIRHPENVRCLGPRSRHKGGPK